jgi:hypothetical protein
MGQRIANERRARSQRRAAHMPIDLPIDCDWFDVQEKDYGPAARLSKQYLVFTGSNQELP